MHRKIIGTSITVGCLTLLAVQPAQAFHQRVVLGESTTAPAEQGNIPPTTDGPGFILPDSPLYFLDTLKQQVRVTLAFSPEAKAKVYKAIAGERMAELRMMLAKKNTQGATIALTSVSDNLQKAQEKLSDAQLAGKDVKELAKALNDDIKNKQQNFELLQTQSNGVFKERVQIVSKHVDEIKIGVEDTLPEDEIQKEIEEHLNKRVENRVKNSEDMVKQVEADLENLSHEASDSAQKSLKRREEVLRKVIEEKNEMRRKEQEKLLEGEKEKQFKIRRLQEEKAVMAKEAIRKAKEAAKQYKELHNEEKRIKKEAQRESEFSQEKRELNIVEPIKTETPVDVIKESSATGSR